MPIAPALQRFVDDELARAPELIARIAAATSHRLRDVKDTPAGASLRAQQSSLAQAFRQHHAAYQQRFVDALRAGVFEFLAEQFEGLPSQGLDTADGLALMDESHVEIDIAISRAMQRLDSAAEWELRELQTFTSTLIGQSHVSADSNPFRPLVYATALWHAACTVSTEQAQQTALLEASTIAAADLLKKSWAAACTRLEATGVTPSVYRTILSVPGTSLGRSGSTPQEAASSAFSNLLAGMPAGSAGMRVSVEHAALPMGASTSQRMALTPPGARSPEFDQALQRLDELLRHLPVSQGEPMTDRHGLVKRLQPHRAALVASATASVERQLIELMARLFDAILTDPAVPPSIQWVLARLQASALRVALSDHEIVESSSHPVWRLIDRICGAGHAYPQPNDPRGLALAAFCNSLAEHLCQAAAPDATLYRRAVTQLDAFLAEQFQAQVRAAEPSIASLQRAERLELLEHILSQRLLEQMEPMRPPPSVRRFLGERWPKVMAESMMHSGEDSETARGSIKLVDELLWSVRLPNHPKSRQRLVALLPSMLQRLRSGMALIGMAPQEQEAFLADLMALHTEALRRGQGEPNLTPEEIVQRMRDEILPAATGQGGFRDSVIDLPDMQTVPAELMPSGAEAPDETARRLAALRPADRLRLFLNGRWSRVQLLWRSEHTSFYLFAGEAAAHTHSITHRALQRLNDVGLLEPLEAKSAVGRALDKVSQDLFRAA